MESIKVWLKDNITLFRLLFAVIIIALYFIGLFDEKITGLLLLLFFYIVLLFDFDSLSIAGFIEMKKATKEAKETIEELKKLSVLISKPILDLIPDTGTWYYDLSIRDLLNYKDEFQNLFKDLKLSKSDTENMFDSIDITIISHLLVNIENRFNKDKDFHIKLNHFIHQDMTLSSKERMYKVNISDLKSILGDNINDDIEYICSEIDYYRKNKRFNNFDKLEYILSNKG